MRGLWTGGGAMVEAGYGQEKASRWSSMSGIFVASIRPIRAAAKTAVFVLKVLPMLPSRPLDWVTPQPVVERVRYPTPYGSAEGDLYRPAAGGPHPGVV